MQDCVFCKVISGELSSTKEYEDDLILAFRDIHPSAPTHILVVPKIHILDFESIGTFAEIEVLGKLQAAIGKIVKKINISNAYKVVVNGGKFQEIKHIHYHLLAGFENPDKKF
jgi:histidine triad (HIT) family protein